MNIFRKLKKYGVLGSIKKLARKIRLKQIYEHYFKDKTGLEIGGPSLMFFNNGYMPIYKLATVIDGVNFSSDTVWTGDMDPKNGYIINGKTGTLYISDATDLSMIPDNTYDFILSCNNIEHIANPMKALHQWILKLICSNICVKWWGG